MANKITQLVIAICISLALPTAFADQTALQHLRFKTQHDTPVKISSNIRIVLFAHDMDSKDVIDEMLAGKPEDYLKQHDAIYVANVSGMPRIIARMFAYPAMREKPYDIWLDESGTQTGDWLQSEGKVTIFQLDNFRIVSSTTTDNIEELNRILAKTHTESTPATSIVKAPTAD